MIDKELARCALKTLDGMIGDRGKGFDFVPLNIVESIRPWVVVPERGDDELELDGATIGKLLYRAQQEASAASIKAGPSRFYGKSILTRHILSERELIEFVKLIAQQAINQYKAQHEQAVRP